ncbi:hypothetical protein [Terrisporobacter sp.]|uniref:hypothetical protein n=1 Tax=Terrisporobacter sp. TaxID=1965305 RepID=UPI00289F28C7|nr:hypothetical protein [Terrisporobacter sp.]
MKKEKKKAVLLTEKLQQLKSVNTSKFDYIEGLIDGVLLSHKEVRTHNGKI